MGFWTALDHGDVRPWKVKEQVRGPLYNTGSPGLMHLAELKLCTF